MKPITPMLAKQIDSDKKEIVLKRQKQTVAEIKYDGFRLQIVKDANDATLYTRNLNVMPIGNFPELAANIRKLPPGIFDCELLGEGFEQNRQQAFWSVGKRAKSYEPGIEKRMPLEIRMFDVMNVKGEDVMGLEQQQRRQIVEEIARHSNISPVKQELISGIDSLEAAYRKVVGQGLEGLVCKDMKGLYIPGGREIGRASCRERV